jgi:hypothetical protein
LELGSSEGIRNQKGLRVRREETEWLVAIIANAKIITQEKYWVSHKIEIFDVACCKKKKLVFAI